MPQVVDLAKYLRGCRSWADLQRRWSPLSTDQKGNLFEQLTKHYLLLEPRYSSKLSNIWPYRNVPPRVARLLHLPPREKGADLIAETKEGDYWSIQCKWITKTDQPVPWSGVSKAHTFAFDVCKGISFLLFASTTQRVTSVIKESKKVGFLCSDDWFGLDQKFFRRLQNHLCDRPNVPKPRLPRSHQKKAIADAFTYFVKKKHKRGKLIMPCATGKSLTAYFIAQKLKAQKIVIAVPSLSLIKQTLKDWMYESMARKQDVEWICVCSDESAGKVEQDDAVVFTQDLGVPCLTNSNKIAQWLKRKRTALTIVFTTYQSGQALAKAVRKAGFTFDFGIMDEAHKTAGTKDRPFSHLILDKNIKIARRLFMTATERSYRGESDEVLSMKNPDDYGKTIHKLSFRKALDYKPAILSDYKIVTIHISQEEIAELVRNRAFVKPKTKGWSKEMEAENLTALIALRNAMKKYPIRHAVSFHGSIKRAEDFKKSNDAYSKSFPSNGRLETFHVSGKTPTGTRAKIVDEFSKAPRSLVTNARCLTEGVDVPNIDAVLFADPKKSLVDIVQAVGRALRPWPNKKFGYVIVPAVHKKNAEPDDIFDSDPFKEVLTTVRALGTQDDDLIEYFRLISQGKRPSGRCPFENVPTEVLAKRIDLREFTRSVELRCWDRLALLTPKSFNEARSFTRKLGLRSHKDWRIYIGPSGRKRFPEIQSLPPDIPKAPDHYYNEWTNWGDFLGTGNTASRLAQWMSFTEARRYARRLKLNTQREWQIYTRSNRRPETLPSNPQRVYRNGGWKGFPDFLGNSNISNTTFEYLPFKRARAYIRRLGLRNTFEWYDYASGRSSRWGKKPRDIPSKPNDVYKNHGWKGMNDWIGHGVSWKDIRANYFSYVQSCRKVRALGIRSQSEFNRFCRTPQRPTTLPWHPHLVYKEKGWVSWPHFFGTNKKDKN